MSPLYFVGAGIVLGLFSVGFVLMSRHIENAGAFYSYIQAGLGKIAGGGSASLALISYTVLIIGTYAYFGLAASAAVDQYLSVDLKWWICALGAVLVTGILGYRDIGVSARVLGVMLIVETAIVLIVDFAIVLKGGHSGLSASPLNPAHVLEGAPGLGLAFAFLGFFGFEATAVFRSEARDPDRTIPRATYISVALIGFVYCLTAWCMAVGIGPSDALATISGDPSNTLQNLGAEYVGTAMTDVIVIFLVTSLLAGLLTFQNVIARYQFNLARGKLLPAFLAKVHPKHGAPSLSSLVASAISFGILAGLAIGGVDPLTKIYPWFTGVAALGIIVLMVLTSLAVIAFHQRNRGAAPAWNSVVAPALATVGLGYTLYMVARNFNLLVGSQGAANVIFVLTIVAFAIGAIVVGLAKATRPEKYDELLSD